MSVYILKNRILCDFYFANSQSNHVNKVRQVAKTIVEKATKANIPVISVDRGTGFHQAVDGKLNIASSQGINCGLPQFIFDSNRTNPINF